MQTICFRNSKYTVYYAIFNVTALLAMQRAHFQMIQDKYVIKCCNLVNLITAEKTKLNQLTEKAAKSCPKVELSHRKAVSVSIQELALPRWYVITKLISPLSCNFRGWQEMAGNNRNSKRRLVLKI
jgi:hypothetical protein